MTGTHDGASALARLMRWYEAQCDGDWEHGYGLRIESMDDPGWSVLIDLAETGVPPEAIAPREERRSEHDWIRCSVQPGCVFSGDQAGYSKFIGYGGPRNLEELIGYFLRCVGA
jgi:hypothetical protein